MRNLRRCCLVLVGHAVLFLGTTAITRADAITSSNGNYSVGMYVSDGAFPGTMAGDHYGLIGDYVSAGVGFQNQTNTRYVSTDPNSTMFDGFNSAPGRDAYGITAGPYSGYVDLQNAKVVDHQSGGIYNIIPSESAYSNNGTSAKVTTYLTANDGVTPVIKITQNFSFLGAQQNVLQDTITLQNVTLGTPFQADLPVQFRRVDSLFVSADGSINSNQVTIDPLAGPVTSTAPYSFVPVTKVAGGDTESPNPAYPFVLPMSGGTLSDPLDYLGAGLNYNVGTLFANPGTTPGVDLTTKTFNLYFAINYPGETESQLRAELNGLGVNYIISDSNGNANGPYVVAIGTQIPSSPEPTTLALLGIGLAGLVGARWRRARGK